MYKDFIFRYRVILMSCFEPDIMELMHQRITAKLRASTIHNSTVYLWNSAFYV